MVASKESKFRQVTNLDGSTTTNKPQVTELKSIDGALIVHIESKSQLEQQQ
jgi:hypothetical protein